MYYLMQKKEIYMTVVLIQKDKDLMASQAVELTQIKSSACSSEVVEEVEVSLVEASHNSAQAVMMMVSVASKIWEEAEEEEMVVSHFLLKNE